MNFEILMIPFFKIFFFADNYSSDNKVNQQPCCDPSQYPFKSGKGLMDDIGGSFIHHFNFTAVP